MDGVMGWIALGAVIAAVVTFVGSAPGVAALLARDRDRERRVGDLEQLRLADAADRLWLQDELIELRRGMAILVAQLRRAQIEPEWTPAAAGGRVRPRGDERTAGLVALYQRIAEKFDMGEMAELWFDMGWANEMRGDDTREQARELVAFANRRGRLDELVEVCRRLRPEGGF